MMCDIILLQETHSKLEIEKQWEHGWGRKMLCSFGSSNARGVAILFRNGFDINLDSFKMDAQGRFLVVKGNIDDNIFTNEDNIVIGGDFNCPLNPQLETRWVEF